MKDPFDFISSLFWSRVVGTAPAHSTDAVGECAINGLIDGHLLDVGVRAQTGPPSTIAEKHQVWLDVRGRICRHAAEAIRQIPVDIPVAHPLHYYSVALLPRIVLATFLRSIGYPDTRRVLFEESVAEEAIPDAATLVFAFLETYRFEYDLMKRGSELLGPRRHSEYHGDPVLGEQLLRWEDPSRWPLPPPMATGMLYVLSTARAAAISGVESRYSITSGSMTTLLRLGVPKGVVEGLAPIQDDISGCLEDFKLLIERSLGHDDASQYESRILVCSRNVWDGDPELCLDDLMPLCRRAARPDWLQDPRDVRLIEGVASRMASGRSRWVQAMSSQMPLRALDMLSGPDTRCAEWAITALRKSGTVSIAPLVAMLRDPGEEVRLRAVRALAGIGRPAIDPLIAVLAEDQSCSYASAALVLMGEAAVPTLGRVISTADSDNLRSVAAVVLATIEKARG